MELENKMKYPEIFESYLQHAPSSIQIRLKKIYRIFFEYLPQAQLVMSYQMPTFKGKKNLVHFAFYENHIGIYPGPQGITYLLTISPKLTTSKGAWRMLHAESLPVHTLNTLAQWLQDRA
jgi:uncharacterized protein YdhG (YjbR/CyaY superfamily)